MNTGSEVGALLVDGLGDGVAVSCPSQDLSFLRNMSFGVLQGSRMRNTKTGAPVMGLVHCEWAFGGRRGVCVGVTRVSLSRCCVLCKQALRCCAKPFWLV